MRHLLLIALLALPTTLAAQAQTGRHYQRQSRMVETKAAPAAQDATAQKQEPAPVAPLRKLRSGRAWPSWHFTREVTTEAPASPTEASAQPPRLLHPADKKGFWQRYAR